MGRLYSLPFFSPLDVEKCIKIDINVLLHIELDRCFAYYEWDDHNVWLTRAHRQALRSSTSIESKPTNLSFDLNNSLKLPI